MYVKEVSVMKMTLERKLDFIHKFTKLDIHIIHHNNIRESNYGSEPPVKHLIEDMDVLIKALSNENEDRTEPYIIQGISPLGFKYIIIGLLDDTIKAVCLGPILFEKTDTITAYTETLPSEIRFEVLDYLSTLQEFTPEEQDTIGLMLFNLLNHDLQVPNIHYSDHMIQSVEDIYDDPIDRSDINLILEERFKLEAELLEAVRTGNVKKLQKVNSRDENYNEHILKKREGITLIRNTKDLMVTTNSICLRAARQGGLPTIVGYQISNHFAVEIEHTNDLKSLYKLRIKIPMAYCKYINFYMGQNYSRLVKKTIEYIIGHLDESITLDGMAKVLYAEPTYLSRRFKFETGQNITQFINKERIKYAKHLIKENKYSLTVIGYHCGYNSYTQFSRNFKKYEGCSPKYYMEKQLSHAYTGL